MQSFSLTLLYQADTSLKRTPRVDSKILLVEFLILGFGIRNTAQGVWNTITNDWNPESMYQVGWKNKNIYIIFLAKTFFTLGKRIYDYKQSFIS